MKKLMFLSILFVLFSVSNVFAQSCTTIGVKDCRVTSKGVCHWWECQQTGSVKQMIFTGKTCKCPRSELNMGGDQVAKAGCEIETSKSVQPVSRRSE
jgi:hypothetical protein